MKRITEDKKSSGKKKQMTGRKKAREGTWDVGSEGQRERAVSFKAILYVYQSNVCRNNGFKGQALHNAAFNKMHRIWKTYIPKK